MLQFCELLQDELQFTHMCLEGQPESLRSLNPDVQYNISVPSRDGRVVIFVQPAHAGVSDLTDNFRIKQHLRMQKRWLRHDFGPTSAVHARASRFISWGTSTSMYHVIKQRWPSRTLEQTVHISVSSFVF